MARVTIPGVGSVGLVADQQPHELPISALSGALNVRLRDGSAERISGEIPSFTAPIITPRSIQVYNSALGRFVVHAGSNAVYADSGANLVDITGTAPTGADGDKWTGGTLNGVLIMNNGVDQPMYWGGDIALTLAPLPSWTSTWRCAVMRPFKTYLVGLDWTKAGARYPQMVKWSSPADPGTTPASWNEADPAVDAGELDLAETADLMVDALPLGDALIIYKSASMYAMSYIGGQYIFNFRKLPGEAGMLARGCACVIPSGHLVLTAGDVIVHNGQGPTSILTGRLRKWLFDNMDANYFGRSFVVSNPAYNEAWICFPTTGSIACTRAIIYNWADNTLSLRELAGVTCGTSGQFEYSSTGAWSTDVETWADDLTTWNASDIPLAQSRIIMGATGPVLLAVDIGTSFSGAAFGASIERIGLSMDTPDVVKTVKAVYPRIDGVTGGVVYVQVGAAMDVEGNYTWSAPVVYTIGTTYRADTFATGRFLAYRVYSTDAINWRIKSMDFELSQRGKY